MPCEEQGFPFVQDATPLLIGVSAESMQQQFLLLLEIVFTNGLPGVKDGVESSDFW